MIRYKNTLRAGDLLWNLLFFTTFLTYTVDVETCETGLITIARHEFDYLKEGAREKDKAERYKTELDAALVESGKKSEKINLLQKENEENKSKTQYVEEEKQGGIVSRNSRPVAWKEDFDRPILKNYKEYILKQFLEETQPFTILFSSGKSELAKEEKNKLELYAKEFKEKYFQNKILLIGHSDWTGHQKLNLDLSFERANLVSKYLIKIGVPEDKIHITFSGGLWPENNGEKLVKSWNRRVDLLILE
jgi:outer membrane protein OmpA-like peptidoglycan-associated protein